MVSTTTARSLLTANIDDNTTNNITPADIRGVFTAAFDAIDLAASGGAIDFTKGQIAGEITSPANKTYIVDLRAPFAYTATALYLQTSAGTCSCTIQVNGTSIPDLTLIAAESASLNGTAAFSSNAVPLNAKVTMVVSNVSGASELSFSLRYTRT